MLCPSCDVEHFSENCPEGIVDAFDSEIALDADSKMLFEENSEVAEPVSMPQPSRLIEFPGVARRSVPEWRKELSARVREVQERRAREATAEAEEAARLNLPLPAGTPQLELLPQTEPPEVNPVVAAALRRIERAHKPARAESYSRAATAVAVAHEITPETELDIDFAAEAPTASALEEPMPTESAPPERTHNLVVVQAPVIEAEIVEVIEPIEKPKPKRLIIEDDPALSYLDSIGAVSASVKRAEHASLARRCVGAVLDVITVAFLSLPVAAVIELQDGNWRQLKTIALMTGIATVLMFLYATAATALTGRTLGMRILSLRAVDTRTGLIPTGNQSAGRALFYLLTLATGGLGLLMVFAHGEHRTVHDRFTQTAVVPE